MATDKEYKALINALSGECERLHKENEELKALSQEPCKGQTMTREDAIEKLELMRQKVDEETYRALILAIKALEQEPCDDDAISRKRALEPYKYLNDDDVITVWMIKKNINELPPVKPQKSGKWIEQEGWDGDVYYECSMCGEAFCLIDGTPTDNMYNYCPNCGAKMESEDKE